MGRPSHACKHALPGSGWQRRLKDSITAGTGHAGADNLVHNKTSRNVFQFLSDILAQTFESAAALFAIFTGRQLSLNSFQMIG